MLAADLERWAWALLGVSIVLLAFLINRFAPSRRHGLRRLVVLFGLYCASHGFAVAFDFMHVAGWADGAHAAGAIFKALIVVGLIGTTIFDLLLPAFKIDVVSITRDVIVGVSYIIAGVIAMHGAGMNLSS